ncbi:hypothetical protein F5I97DRAFT_731297 [Phlebopus sp. FC_14]|nr:hypothetical protein F5I97DRAFT_731297 [Phlebopus sp. FC_14]
MSSSFAALPSELILFIISLAAEHQPTALALSLVSSWVHRQTEPALYHTVRLSSSRALTSFISTLDNKPPAFAGRTVKKLCITALGPISGIETVLARCTGVTSLACGFSVPSYIHCVRHDDLPLRQEHEAEHKPQKLVVGPKEQHLIALACRDGLDMSVVSSSVTHLRIQLTSAMTSESIAQLAELRELTHLAIVYKQGSLGGLEHVKEMLRPVIQGGTLRLLIHQLVGGGEIDFEEIRRWNLDELDEHARNLTIVAERAPRSIMSQWEDSDSLWCTPGVASSVDA